MPAPVAVLSLSDSDKQQLLEWASAFGTPQQVALRCRIVLAAASGQSDLATAEQLKTNRHTVRLWRTRFIQQGLKSLWEIAPGRGRQPSFGPEKIQTIVDTTLQSKPKGQTHWSCRSLAEHLGVSKSTVNNIWRSHNLKPHRVKTFKLSRDPHFLQKLTDVVGLYLNPPEQAIVLCVDEKSQIQALDRTQPGLPMKKGRYGTLTHDYKRNGTTTLFAALELAQGKVVGECYQRHRHQEFLKFLRRLDEEFPGPVSLHLVMDNYGTHTKQEVHSWLKRHRRFVLHFVPTSSSWLNLVERWFGELSRQCIRRGAFFSVEDLKKAIREFLDTWNENPRPFVWTATVDSIMEKLSRCRRTLEKIQPGCTRPRSRKKSNNVV
jgi:transposase